LRERRGFDFLPAMGLVSFPHAPPFGYKSVRNTQKTSHLSYIALMADLTVSGVVVPGYYDEHPSFPDEAYYDTRMLAVAVVYV